MDTDTQANLIQWPIEETEKLRSKKYDEFKDVELKPGSLIPLEIGTTTQVNLEDFIDNKISLVFIGLIYMQELK